MPASFQPRFEISPRIVRQLVAIERTVGFLEAVRLQDAWVADLRSGVQIRDALASLRIEGSSLTLEDAYSLVGTAEPPTVSDSGREFLNYLAAFEAVDGLRGEKTYQVRRGDVLSLHSTLVSGVRGGDRFAGRLRREQVVVGDVDGEETVVRHRPPNWTEVEEGIDGLLDWIEASKRKATAPQLRKGGTDPWVHPVLVAGIAQHELVRVHPFIDGNGRTARMLTTLLLYQRGYDFKYLFDLSTYYDRDRDKYYGALRTADATGDHTAWLEYFVGGFSYQLMGIQQKARKAALSADTSDSG